MESFRSSIGNQCQLNLSIRSKHCIIGFSSYQADFSTNVSGVDEQARVSCEDFVDFSDIFHSNEEYFRKLEELKAAHMETMAKLEKMYQNN